MPPEVRKEGITTKIVEFSESQREALGKYRPFFFDLEGLLVKNLVGSGQAVVSNDIYDQDGLEAVRSMKSQVAVLVNLPFLEPLKDQTFARQDEAMVLFSDIVAENIPGVRMIIPNAAVGLEILNKAALENTDLLGKAKLRTNTKVGEESYVYIAKDEEGKTKLKRARMGGFFGDLTVMAVITPEAVEEFPRDSNRPEFRFATILDKISDEPGFFGEPKDPAERFERVLSKIDLSKTDKKALSEDILTGLGRYNAMCTRTIARMIKRRHAPFENWREIEKAYLLLMTMQRDYWYSIQKIKEIDEAAEAGFYKRGGRIWLNRYQINSKKDPYRESLKKLTKLRKTLADVFLSMAANL